MLRTLLLLSVLGAPHPLHKWCGEFPIPFHIDASAPPEVQELMRAGALAWNKIDIGVGPLLREATDEDVNPLEIVWNAAEKSLLCGYAPNTVEVTAPECIVARELYVFVNAPCDSVKRWETVVTTHEVGHFLGLEHSGDPKDVMFFLLGDKQRFTRYEIDELRKRYVN